MCRETDLLQTPVLCKSPIGHDTSSNHKKNITSNSLCSNVESYPLIDLCRIICTCNNIEEKATWDLISTIPFRPTKIPQQNMAIEIRNLTEYPKPESYLHLEITYRGKQWMVYIVCNITAKCPVISTVAKHI